jgi:subtilisin family serine protease
MAAAASSAEDGEPTPEEEVAAVGTESGTLELASSGTATMPALSGVGEIILSHMTQAPPAPVENMALLMSETLTAPFLNDALLEELPSVLGPVASPAAQSEIMVFDFPLAACHPVIRHAITGSTCPEAPIPTSYGVLADPKPQKKHHGTHVSGLVVGAQGIGVYPTSKLHYRSLIAEGAPDKTIFDNDLEQAIHMALSLRLGTVRVANMSVDFNLSRQSAIYERLENKIDSTSNVLFVAAAGDQPGSLDGVCEIVPACLRAKRNGNLMVVGGARKDAAGNWVVHENSRYGQRVDILAPADKILSAASDPSALVRLSGTSQATAIVSGVAARIFDTPAPQDIQWSPAQVKNRLKATARINPALTEKTASGVLNAPRALDTERQMLVYKDKDRAELVTVYGQLLGLVNENEVQENGFIPIGGLGFKDDVVSFCLMYRYHRQDNGDITLFVEPPNTPMRWARMTGHSRGRLQISSKYLLFRISSPPYSELKIPIRDVSDFVDKFSGDRACSSVGPSANS